MHDKRLLERIFKAQYPRLKRIAKSLLYNDKEAEDIVFDVFAKLLERDFEFTMESELYRQLVELKRAENRPKDIDTDDAWKRFENTKYRNITVMSWFSTTKV